MAITIPAAPAQSLAALREALVSVGNRPALTRVAPRLASSLTAKDAASMTPTLSYQVYTLGLSDLVAGAANDLKGAKPSLWRYTLTSEGEVVTADTAVDQTGTNYTFAALSISSTAADVQTTINALDQDPTIAKATYELRLLQISALGVRAVWLHDATGKSPDILVPVAPVRPELVAGRQYDISKFVGALKNAAAEILANDDPRKGAS